MPVTCIGNLRKTPVRDERGIVNHCRSPIHTGRLEGIGNKIRLSSARRTASATTPTSS